MLYDPSVCLSVRLSVRLHPCPTAQRCVLGLCLLRNTNRKPHVGRRTHRPYVAGTATKSSPAPLQKHSQGGCTKAMPRERSNCHRRSISFHCIRPIYIIYKYSIYNSITSDLHLSWEDVVAAATESASIPVHHGCRSLAG